jgi:DNA-binding winged helix-turn-helix (wHTH) protein/TolB-like protein/tetratricopeptide (TPR) repeat protein
MATEFIGEYEFGGFRIEVAARRLLAPSADPVDLSARAFDVLLHLVEHRGTDVSKERLLSAAWPDTVVEENNLNQAITVLRRALGDQRSAPRFIMTVPGRGYRFVAKVVETAGGPRAGLTASPEPAPALVLTPAPAATLSPGPALSRPTIWSHRRTLAVGLLFALALAAVLAAMRIPGIAGEAPITTLAVLPFRPLVPVQGNPALELGMAESLISQISVLPGIAVRSQGAVANLRGTALDPIAAGRQLGVAAVLEGTQQQQNGRIRVTARLLRVSNGRSLWSGQFDEQMSDIFEVQDSISSQVMQRLAAYLNATAPPRPSNPPTRNDKAYQLWALGVFNFQRRDIDGTPAAVEYFNAAILEDENYALARAWLATTRASQSAFGILPAQVAMPEAKLAAQRAIDIDAKLALGQAAMGQVLVQYENRFLEGEAFYRRALELDRNLGIAHLWTSISNLYLGRTQDALAAALRAQELETGNMAFSANVGRVLYYSRKYDAAATHLRRLIKAVPTFDDAHTLLGRALLQQGQVDQALAQFRARNRTSPGSFGDIGRAYAAAGRRSEAHAEIDKLGAQAQRGFGVSYDIAGIHALLGETALACSTLKQALDDHSQAIGLLRVDPDMDHLRNQPCYVEIEHALYKDQP